MDALSPMIVVADTDLLSDIAQRMPQALGQLYDRYGTLAFALAIRLTRDSTTACLVTEAVFDHIWNNPAQITLVHDCCTVWLIAATAKYAAPYQCAIRDGPRTLR